MVAVAKANPEFDAFDKAIGQLLSVPREEMVRRIEAHKQESLKNPNRRGPKPRKSKPSEPLTLHPVPIRHNAGALELNRK